MKLKKLFRERLRIKESFDQCSREDKINELRALLPYFENLEIDDLLNQQNLMKFKVPESRVIKYKGG